MVFLQILISAEPQHMAKLLRDAAKSVSGEVKYGTFGEGTTGYNGPDGAYTYQLISLEDTLSQPKGPESIGATAGPQAERTTK